MTDRLSVKEAARLMGASEWFCAPWSSAGVVPVGIRG